MDKNKEITDLISNEFDTRCEVTVLSYILEKGINQLVQIDENDIMNNINGNEIMTKEFLQALVRTATNICKKYTPIEIMEYIRIECWFSPFPKSMDLYKDDFTEYGWSEICKELDEDESENKIKVMIIKKGD